MSIILKRHYARKPPRFTRPSNLYDGCFGLWGFFNDSDHANLITGANDGVSAQTSILTPTDIGLTLSTDGVNSGFYSQTLRGIGNPYSAPDTWTDVALVRAIDFFASTSPNWIIGHVFGSNREAGIRFPTSAGNGRVNYVIDATGDDISNFTTDRDDLAANWDLGILAGGSIGNQAFLYFRSCPLGTGTKQEYLESGANIWSGNVGGERVSLGHRTRSGFPVSGGVDIYWAAHFNRVLHLYELDALARSPFLFWERRIWVPAEAGPPEPIQLDIDDTRHARAVDQVDVVELVTIVPIDIDSLSHGRRLDSLLLGVLFDLFLASLRHGRPIDAVAIDVSVDLDIDVLRHARRVDDADVQALVGIVLDVSDQRHRRPVDSLLLDVDQPISIDGLRHGRPIDAAAVQPLLGHQTGIGATASNWILDAGQPLNNATSVDFDYHVLEGIFDSDQSVLGVDGARVTGSAGMRELTALTLGANVDGQERVQGEIAELRIYAGVLSQADRDRILQELIAKWITG